MPAVTAVEPDSQTAFTLVEAPKQGPKVPQAMHENLVKQILVKHSGFSERNKRRILEAIMPSDPLKWIRLDFGQWLEAIAEINQAFMADVSDQYSAWRDPGSMIRFREVCELIQSRTGG